MRAASPKARLERKGQLAARSAAADYENSNGPTETREGFDARVDFTNEFSDGSGREGVTADSRKVEPANGGAYIETRDVESQRWASFDPDLMAHWIDVDGRRQDYAGAGAAGKGNHIDLEFREPVVSSHEPRDHARVDRSGPIENDQNACVSRRIHRPATQDLNMGVTAAHEHDRASPATLQSQSFSAAILWRSTNWSRSRTAPLAALVVIIP